MWGEFVKATGGKLAERGLAVGAAALVFWVGLVAFWVMANGGLGRLSAVAAWLGAQASVVQLGVVGAGVLAAAVPGIVVSRLTTPTLRILEGYWPSWARRVQDKRVEALQKQHTADMEAWQLLQAAVMRGKQISPADLAEHTRLDGLLHRRPNDPQHFMATRTGNILKAAEDRPRAKYGLDSVIVWPRLWLVMPDSARKELASARGSLDAAVAGSVWAGLFAVSGLFLLGLSPSHAWWLGCLAFAVGVVVAVSIVRWWVPMRAAVFGDLVESAFDLYRFGLYEQLRWPLPGQPETEQSVGMDLTAYLWRGEVPDNSISFTVPKG